MREIHPFNMPVNEAMQLVPEMKPVVEQVRRQKEAGQRLKPSLALIDESNILSPTQRQLLIDKIAELVDENYCGRSEMCQQFAVLMQRALDYLGYKCRVATGTSVYYDAGGITIFRWPDDGHYWVVVGDEIIDGNLDSLYENIEVPNEVQVKPYWGLRSTSPRDRKYHENRGAPTIVPDVDVEEHWWPDLNRWIDQNIKR